MVRLIGGRYLAKDSGVTLDGLEDLNQDLVWEFLQVKQISVSKNLVRKALIKDSISICL